MLKNIVIGIIAGLISGFFSTGGGLILVPAFIYFIKLDEKKARATSIACILPMVITSSIFYAKNKCWSSRPNIYYKIKLYTFLIGSTSNEYSSGEV